VREFPPAQRRLLLQALRRGLNCPLTTSAGRLFDAVAALLGLCQVATYEAQAAQRPEWALVPDDGAYPLPVRGEEVLVADRRLALEALLSDLRQGVPVGVASARFHNALVEAIVEVARAVALTGGCLQNRYLTERAVARLQEEGVLVLWHRQVPPDDGGIALGQLDASRGRGEGE